MSAGFSKVNIVGDKVRLRPIRESDAKTAYPLLTDEAILSQLLWDGPAELPRCMPWSLQVINEVGGPLRKMAFHWMVPSDGIS